MHVFASYLFLNAGILLFLDCVSAGLLVLIYLYQHIETQSWSCDLDCIDPSFRWQWSVESNNYWLWHCRHLCYCVRSSKRNQAVNLSNSSRSLQILRHGRGWVSQALIWLFILKTFRNASKWPASQTASAQKVLCTTFSTRRCSY